MLMRAITLVRCTVSGLALSLAATAAQAQQATTTTTDPAAAAADDTPQGDDIVVTGLRASLESVRNIRRNSDEIIDAVVAEDIAKLPDLNTAQIAARIPGVQVYRQGGEAQNVLVRGLPSFTTTYNGREIFTAETRIVALQDFPAANVAALEVYKTSAADLVEPGLAGLVNVRSRQPFDFEDGQIAGSVWGLYTRQGRKLDPNFNFLATKRWDVGDGGELGVLLNASRVEMTYLDAEISNTDFLMTFRNAGNGTLAPDFPAGTAARLPDIQRLFYRSGNRVRPSVNGAIQYKPNSNLEFYLEGLWQGFRNKIDDRLLAAELFNGLQTSGLVLRDGTNLVRSGTVNAPAGSLFSFQGATYNRTDTYQFAGGIKATFDKLNVHIDVARTDSTFTGSTESVDRRWSAAPTIRFDTDRPAFEITNINFADPSAQFFDGLYEENQRSAGDDWQFRGDLEYLVDGSFIRSIQAGVRYTDRDAVREFGNRFSRPGVPTNASSLPVTFDVFRGVNVGGTYRWAAPTYGSVRDNIVALRGLVGFGADPVNRNLLYTASEKNLAGYGQVNLGSGDLEGTVGIRYTRVKTRVAGPTPTGIPQIDEGSTRDSWLPNASIRFRATPEIQLRAAVSKTRTLASFADLNPALVLSQPPQTPDGLGTEAQPRIGFGGNPFLQPFTSWNFDAAVEYYFSRTGFVSVTGFHRQLDGFIQPGSVDIPNTPVGFLRIFGPENTGKGRITGVELQGQVFADIESLPDWAQGFGMQVNVTYIDAKTQQNDGAGGLSYQEITDQLNGVSKWNANVVAIYERYGASARLSYNDRSSYRATQQFRGSGNPGDAGNDIYTERARPAGRLDLSLSYNINDDFAIFGDWTNITRERFRQDFSSARNGAPRADFIRYLRDDESTLSLGFRFRFGR
jgi:TonB-dependent receptor